MKDFDTTQLKKAIVYTERMINGHHPVNNSLLNPDDTLRDNQRVQKYKKALELLNN